MDTIRTAVIEWLKYHHKYDDYTAQTFQAAFENASFFVIQRILLYANIREIPLSAEAEVGQLIAYFILAGSPRSAILFADTNPDASTGVAKSKRITVGDTSVELSYSKTSDELEADIEKNFLAEYYDLYYRLIPRLRRLSW